MMETNFTFKKLTARMLVVVMLAVFSISQGYAQPSCACKTSVNVSLSAAGVATVTPEMVLADGNTCGSDPTVSISETPTGPAITGSPQVNCDHVGKTLYAKVTSSGTPSNSCWATLFVEDKIKPVINCPQGIQTYTCTEMNNFNINSLVSDACGIEKVDVINETITVNNCSNGLPANVLKTVVRTYQATDKNGNVSNPCTITFRVTTITDLGPSTIVYPLNYDIAPGGNPALQCDGNYPKLPNGNPNPLTVGSSIGTGAPFIGNTNLYQDQSLYCGLLVTYTDAPPIKVNCVTKYIRTWQVFEWSCRNLPAYQYVQIIEVVDTEGPEISGLSDLSSSTGNHNCLGTVTFANATLADNCAATSSLTADITIYPNKNLSAPGIFIKHGSSKTVNLPVGAHLAVYTAYDDCYNSSTASITVTVEDNTPPVAVCDEQATIGLTSDGTAWVPATVFDDGSFDECAMGKLLVRRMTPINCQPCETPEFPGFKYIGTIGSGTNQRYYYLSNHKATPKVALKTARAMGGYGVSYETMPERNAVKGFVEAAVPDISFLIGLTDTKTEGSYLWETNAASSASVTGNSADKDYVIVESYPTPNPNNGRLLAVDGETAYHYVVEITDPCGWSSHAEFCCADIATPKMVALRAIDASGNFNDCMVNTIIQDKIGPTITCPDHMTVDCDFAYDPQNLRRDFGWPEVTDNCENPNIVESPAVISINNCRIGTITRSFTVTDMGGRTATCSQVITFAPSSSQVYNGPTSAQWPQDRTVNGCGNLNDPLLLPAVTGSPILTDGACSLVGSQYVDEVYSFNNPSSPACFKILRKWTVIDWCQPLQGGGYRTWTDIQEIKVIDNVAPVIAPTAPSVSADTFDPNCESGNITLTASASDVCTNVLRWTYRIDAFNNGSFDITNTGNGNAINASGSYPVGVHKIVYSFEDKCGNVTSREQIFSIVNKKAPSVYVKQGLAMSLMQTAPGVGMAVIWATDFDNGSSHPCGYDLYFSFTPVTVQNVGGVPTLVGTPSATFDCGDRGENDVTIYVAALTPAGDVVQASVETFIDIQDNGTPKICPGTGPTTGGRATVSGAMSTENKEMVQNVSVTLMGAEMNKMTGVDGAFGFADVPAGGQYTVMPEKNDDPLNGVSTLDLVFIQRHILNVQKLDSPYKLIAADANKDGKITASDLVELRKLILGTNTAFSNNKSWRFVDKSYTFKDPSFAQGEAFPEAYYIDNLDTDMATDFIAVKTGDVNGSVKASNIAGETVFRNASTLHLITNEQKYKAGTEIKVPVRLAESETITGMQFTLDFDQNALQLMHIDPAMSGMSDQNFGFNQLGAGKVTFSWNADQPRSLSKDDVLFTLTFRTTDLGSLAESLALNSVATAAEAYTSDFAVIPVQMEVANRNNLVSQSQKTFVLHQNVPNPFKEVSNISFELPATMPVNISIYNLSGKMIKEYQVNGQQGVNTLEINRNDLTTGILYYTMKAGDFTTTKKMVVIE